MQCGEARHGKVASMHAIAGPRQRSVFTKHRFSASMMWQWKPGAQDFQDRATTVRTEECMATKTIESVLQETRLFPPSPAFVKQANVSGQSAYAALCAEAEKDLPGFWARLAREHVLWQRPFTRVLDESKPPFYRWF